MAAGKGDEGTPDDPIRRRLEKATANPLRKEILEELNRHPGNSTEVAEALGKSPKTIRHHLRVLIALGYLKPADPTEA